MTAVAQPTAARAQANRTRRLLRTGLGLVAAAQAEVGIWGLASPRGFFTDFPGGGHHWVAAIGPYNEHLIRDYAASELGLALLVVAMAIWFERRLVLAGGAAFLLATIPHFAYHLTTTGSYSTADNLASLASFVLELALVAAAILAVVRRTPDPEWRT
jgi:hypothetical protein